MTSGSEDVPPGLANKDDVVFGNIQDIYEFHNRYCKTYCNNIYCYSTISKCTTVHSAETLYFILCVVMQYSVFCSIFLKELENYEQLPEDVGHCFVTWVTSLF